MQPIVIFDGIFFFFKSSEIRTQHDQRDVEHDVCVRTKGIRAGHESTSCGLRSNFLNFLLLYSVFLLWLLFVLFLVLFRFFCSGSIPSIPFRAQTWIRLKETAVPGQFDHSAQKNQLNLKLSPLFLLRAFGFSTAEALPIQPKL